MLIYLYDENGSPIGMKYRSQYYAEGVFDCYFFEKNLQGDIVAVYNASGAPIGAYAYDAWGNIKVTYGSNNHVVTRLNPFRYRGYYYDVETGFYYLQSRYYNPSWGRFLNADGYVSTGQGLLGYNMFAYCNNNPVVRVDEGGTFWETVIDVFSLGASVVDVVQNPDDPWAWVGLAADTIDLLPFVTGVGEITRAVNTGLKIADKVDDAVDVVKIIDRTEDIIDITTDGIKYTDKVIKQMNNAKDLHHAFPRAVDTFVNLNNAKPLVGGDKVVRNLIEIPGYINKTPGVFEYIIDIDGWCNHRYFKT